MKKASSMKLIKKTRQYKIKSRGKKTTSRTLTNPITGNKRTVIKTPGTPGTTRKQVITTKKGLKRTVISPNKKALVGKQKRLPAGLRQAILDSPAKMLKPTAMKMMKPSAMKLKKKTKVERDHNKAARKTEGSRLRQSMRRLVNKKRK